MGIIDKKTGKIRPAAEYAQEMRDRLLKKRNKADMSLVLFATRIPVDVLNKFTESVSKRGDKIQTVIKQMMIDYARGSDK